MFKDQQKISAFFNEKIDIRERCKGVHCVDLGESFQTSIYLQNLASTQPRTSLVKFARSPRTDPLLLQIPQVAGNSLIPRPGWSLTIILVLKCSPRSLDFTCKLRCRTAIPVKTLTGSWDFTFTGDLLVNRDLM